MRQRGRKQSAAEKCGDGVNTAFNKEFKSND